MCTSLSQWPANLMLVMYHTYQQSEPQQTTSDCLLSDISEQSYTGDISKVLWHSTCEITLLAYNWASVGISGQTSRTRIEGCLCGLPKLIEGKLIGYGLEQCHHNHAGTMLSLLTKEAILLITVSLFKLLKTQHKKTHIKLHYLHMYVCIYMYIFIAYYSHFKYSEIFRGLKLSWILQFLY